MATARTLLAVGGDGDDDGDGHRQFRQHQMDEALTELAALETLMGSATAARQRAAASRSCCAARSPPNGRLGWCARRAVDGRRRQRRCHGGRRWLNAPRALRGGWCARLNRKGAAAGDASELPSWSVSRASSAAAAAAAQRARRWRRPAGSR